MNRNVTLNLAEGDAAAILAAAKAHSQSYNATEMAMISGYEEIKAGLGVTDNQELLQYL
jgi:hypothetical protein